MRPFNILYSLIFLTSSISIAQVAYNDLPETKVVALHASSYFAFDGSSGIRNLYIKVPNSYTNTLECEATIQFEAVTEAGDISIQTATFKDLSVFPDRAFGANMSYELVLPKSQFYYSNVHQVTTSCRGMSHLKHLPREFCESKKLNPDHRLTCQIFAEFGPNAYYPRMQNDTHIGTCSCSETKL